MYLANVGIDTTYRPPAASGGSTYDGRVNRDPQPATSSRTQTYLEDLANQRVAHQANSPQQARTQTTQATNSYTLPYTPSNTDQYWKHDLWENIQNEQRKPKWQSIGTFGGIDRIDPRSVSPELMQQLGLTTEEVADYETGPMGESGVSELRRGGTYLDPASALKLQNYAIDHEGTRPDSKYFGKDWRSVTEHDKYKVLDPRYVIWDDTLGWITHKKNYNPDGDKSWWQKNVSTFLPAAVGTLLGGPAGTAIGLGMGAVKAISGQTDWRSLLPMLLTAGFSLSGANEFLGRLAPYVRGAANYGLGQVTRRGR